MNEKTLYISEYHLDEGATPQEAKRIVELLTAEGWLVAIGETPWHFESAAQRAAFEKAFRWASEVVSVEKRPFDEDVMLDLIKSDLR